LHRCEQNGPNFPANQSPDFLQTGHLTCGIFLLGFRCNRFHAADDVYGVVSRRAAVLQNFLHIVKNLLLLLWQNVRGVENGVDVLRKFRVLRLHCCFSSNGDGEIVGKRGD
jgi:hypothetical protein